MVEFQPKVSIVIPVYNGADYLRQAIESALAQDYANIEILVVNDGSVDGGQTKSVALEFGERIRYFEQENGGVASALNLGLSQMSGEFFSWLSHDDLYTPRKVSRQVEELEKLPESQTKSTIVYSEWKTIDKEGFPVGEVALTRQFPIDKLNHSLFPVFKALLHGCSLLIPTQLLREVGGFDTSLRTTQDYDCWLKLLRRTKNIRFVPEALILSRLHDQQGSKKIAGHLRESDTLWERMFASLTYKECVAIDGSARVFWTKAELFCRSQKFELAERLVLNKLSNLEAVGPFGVWLSYKNRKPDFEGIRKSLGSINGSVVFLEPLSPNEESELKDTFPNLNLKFVPHSGMAEQIRKTEIEYLFYLEAGNTFESSKVADQVRVAEVAGVDWTLSSSIVIYDDGSVGLGVAGPDVTDPSFWSSNFMICVANENPPQPERLREFASLRPGIFLKKPLTQMLDQPAPKSTVSRTTSSFRRLAVRFYKHSGAVYVHHWGRAFISRKRRQTGWRNAERF